MSNLIDKIHKKLKEQSMSVLKLSNEIGIPAYRIYKWLDGKAAPKHEDVKKLEQWLGISEEIVSREINEPPMQYKVNGSHNDYTAEYIQLLKDQLKVSQERLEAQNRLDKLLNELQKNRALLTSALEHIAKLRASVEKKPLEKIQTEMGSTYFSGLIYHLGQFEPKKTAANVFFLIATESY